MEKRKLNRIGDLAVVPTSDEYAPRKYSPREHAATAAKIVLVVGLLFGLLWLLDAMAPK